MLRLVFAATCMLPLLGASAFAQSSARQACDRLLKPAYENVDAYKKENLTMDCACMTSFMIGRYGNEDGEFLIRLFSVFATESEAKLKEVVDKVGRPRFEALLAKVGNFQTVGQAMDKACPPVRKP